MKKGCWIVIVVYCVVLMSSCGEKQEKNAVDIRLFNDGWRFARTDTDPETRCSDSMEAVTLPHTPRLEPLTVTDQWQGVCCYVKSFRCPEDCRNKLLFLRFEGAMKVAEVWLNGRHLITHIGGYLPFTVPLDDALDRKGENQLVVRLDNRDNAVTGPKPLHLLDFCTYGGLYRNVWLVAKDSVYITDPIARREGGIFVRTTDISTERATVDVRITLANAAATEAVTDVVFTIRDKSGKFVSQTSAQGKIAAGKDTTLTARCTVENPCLWSPGTPDLYTLTATVNRNGQVSDREEVRFGIRDLKITPEGLWLNGEKLFLRGVNRHQEYPYIGYALSDEAQRRDARKIKDAGFDYVRLSHYPHSTAFLDACDELGILVLDAILGWQYFGDSLFMAHALQSSRELIRRDRNHPCVLAWELSINETQMPAEFIKAANCISREEYPVENCYTAGWIREAYDVYIEARQHRHGTYLDQPLIVSEYGDWEYYAQNAGFNQNAWNDLLEEERSSRQPRFAGEKRLLQQARNLQEAHNDNLSTHAFADGYWAMFDYNRGYADDQEYSGVMDITRLPKFSYYFFRSQRNTPDVIFVASYWQPGISRDVRVFSNCEEVELYVDGQFVARQKPDSDIFSTRLAHPPFTFSVNCTRPGTVKAVGYKNGQVVAEHSVTTAGVPAQLVLRIDESGVAPARNDVLFVYAAICDAKGNPVQSADTEVTFGVRGATLCSPGTVKAEAGIATALVRTSGDSGTVNVTASTKNLLETSIHFRIP